MDDETRRAIDVLTDQIVQLQSAMERMERNYDRELRLLKNDLYALEGRIN